MELKSAKKRARSSNWDEEEKRILRQLIMEKIDIIEKKDTTTNTNAKKKAAWQEILSSFNSLNKKPRDMTQIVTQWRNTKGLVKTRESEYRRARQMTGGGPPPPNPPQEDLELIQSLPNEFVIDSNVFDSDSIFIETIKQSQSTATEKMMSESGLAPTEIAIIVDSEKSTQLSNTPDVEENPILSTPLAATKVEKHTIKRELYKPKHKPKQNNKIADNYEEQLFLLTKKCKENKEKREDELHKKRMAILDLEQKYWEKKLKNV
ncbi:uncharacterized protein LOC118264907 [Spodoptera frugiperda]|uniref:Regulatory protein zeste n=1 Tax=Spodoptera frugiperda TaxID=7108 RepID=A0A9R0E245_SPOFR|nr:uncharacterized protein LOC118264907 [Spodoptera frugiperda]